MEEKVSMIDKLLMIKAINDEKAKEPIVYKIKGTEEEIVINKPSPEKILNTLDNIEPDTPVMELWDTLVYLAMPELHDRAILEELDCVDNPESVVAKVFSIGDRVAIGQAIKSIITDVSVEEIKN